MQWHFKTQSAVEYLSIYGWAILIISIVLGSLYALGVFNVFSSHVGTECITEAGFVCQSPTISDNGILTLSIGEQTGYKFYNASFYVSPQASPLNSFGYPTIMYPATQNFIYAFSNGETISLSFNLGSQYEKIGESFVGSLWMNFSVSSNGKSNQANKIAIITADVS